VKHAVFRRQPDLVIWINVAQLAEKGVAMTCQTNVARFAGQGGAWYVADGETQRTGVAAGANDGRHAKTRDLDTSDRRARRRP
jgi:hypothetical protein